MYLPNDVWTSPQFDDRSPTIIEAIAQWFSDVFTAVVKWLNKAFTATLDWINDNWPDAANAAVQPLKEHPRVALLISALIFLGPQILLLPLLILQGVFLLVLTLLGFGVQGIIGGSPAAGYQSLCYGGNTPAASLFAILQSIGMKYHVVTLGNWVLAIVRLLAGLVFLYVVLGMTLW
ncbi:hypothetical protein B0H11DRAFT_223198 [Mycena galericulata]|nr:hypothetical protein B0H11DRAFT_223198 [Mycena galericulata]